MDEFALRPPIAFSKGMERVNLTQLIGRPVAKGRSIQAMKMPFLC